MTSKKGNKKHIKQFKNIKFLASKNLNLNRLKINPISIVENTKSKIELVDEVKDNFEANDEVLKTSKKPKKKKIEEHKTIINQNIHQEYSDESSTKKKKVGFFSILLVLLISLISLVILLDTFKQQLSRIYPNIDFYLVSLYDTLKDVFLFFIDLLK